jgi:hypothetical protein
MIYTSGRGASLSALSVPIKETQVKPSNAAFGPDKPHRLHSKQIISKMRYKQLQHISVHQTKED